jgi:Holliday junction resolvasome RuvABC ATP-dependent DNA helicase subunit
MRQLSNYLPKLRENPELNMSFLLRAPSGWGKTRMAFMLCNYLTSGDFEYCIADNVTARFQKRVVFIDEIHVMKNPEWLYPIIDGGKHILVLASNEVSVIPEALSNRCTQLIFEDYSKEELREICRTNLGAAFGDHILDYIIESSAGNPRTIRSICSKINMMNPDQVASLSGDGFKKFMSYMFGIDDGMDSLARRYIAALKELGGTASLKTISTMMHLDESSIRFYVEPVLLYKKMITISSKGRSLV